MNHTPESAADYVSHSNLKGLVEWLTAEAILSRPEDPVQFARDLLGQKLVERSKSADGFMPDEATQWLRATYAKAVAEVDENGVIHGENIPSATMSVAEELAGEKFADADLIGIPTRIIISKKTLAEQSVELKKRSSTQA